MIEQKISIKLCLLGEPGVGKTSLLYRFITSKFRENYKSTLGVNLLKKEIPISNSIMINTHIWDLGGQESFRSLRDVYLNGSNGALIIFDITDEISFNKIPEWIDSYRDSGGNNNNALIIGNKIDLTDQFEIKKKKAIDLSKKYQINLMFTSAKLGNNVEEAFIDLTNKIFNYSFKKNE